MISSLSDLSCCYIMQHSYAAQFLQWHNDSAAEV